MRLISLPIVTVVMVILATATTNAAPTPQAHPAYLHALSDLRDARAHLERPNGGALQRQEQDAIAEIDKAIGEIKSASIDDRKDINDHARVDIHMPWTGRLHTALQLLNRAHGDVAKEEDNPEARGLKRRALEHIDLAHRHVQEAIDVAH